MRDESFQRVAAELLQSALDEGATESEKARLLASPDAIVVKLAFSPHTDSDGAPVDLIVEPARRARRGTSPPGAPVEERLDQSRPESPELAVIYRRISLRSKLGLRPYDCGPAAASPAVPA
jgi:hypothetical protein